MDSSEVVMLTIKIRVFEQPLLKVIKMHNIFYLFSIRGDLAKHAGAGDINYQKITSLGNFV